MLQSAHGCRINIRQPMSNALVAIDTGLHTARELGRMQFQGAFALAREIHRCQIVAVAALQRVIRFQARPFALRELEPFVEKFFARVDGAENRAPHFLGGLNLAGNLVGPVVRHMAIRASGAHAGTVGVMNGRLQFDKNVVAHFMDRDNNFRSEISPRRYFCTQCHVPQMDVRNRVENTFIDAEKAAAMMPAKKAAKK